MNANRLFAASAVMVFGFAATGCGNLSGLLGQSGSHTLASSNNNDVKTISSTQKKQKPAKPKPHYPSFGLNYSGPAVLALNERLAELGYLPVAVSGSSQPKITLKNLKHPPQSNFVWRYSNIPSELKEIWNPDKYTQVTRGAVIAFEHENGIPTDGVVGQKVWKTLLGASAKHNAYSYTYVLVTKSPSPERLRVWKNGSWVYSSLANTGVAKAPTENGTFAVYLRYVSQTMTGTNPDGSHYSDAGVPYVNYFNGSDAVHGFVRHEYGFPQSVGCVELPVSNSQTVWSLINYGTLVTVTGEYVGPTYQSSSGETKTGSSTSTTNKTSKTNTPKPPTKPTNSTGGSSGGGSNNTTSNNITNNTTAGEGNNTNNTTTTNNNVTGNKTPTSPSSETGGTTGSTGSGSTTSGGDSTANSGSTAN